MSCVESPERLVADIETLQQATARQRTALVVGGSALGPRLRGTIPATAHGDSLAQLVELADVLVRGD